MGDAVGEEGQAGAACHRGFGEVARVSGEWGQQEEEEEEAESVAFLDPPFLVVAQQWLVPGFSLVLCRSRCVPLFLAGPVSRRLRHRGPFRPDGQLRGEMSRSSSFFFLQWHVQDWYFWLDTPFPTVVAGPDARHHGRYVPEGLLRVWLVSLVTLHLALCFFPCCQAQDDVHV